MPSTFRDREHGESKFNAKQMATYLQRLGVLAGGNTSMRSAGRFGLVGVAGMVADLISFQMFPLRGLGLRSAHILSFLIAFTMNFVFNDRWAFAAAPRGRCSRGRLYVRFSTVCLLALFLRGAVLAALTAAIGAAAVVNYLGCAFYVFAHNSPYIDSKAQWRIAAVAIVDYMLILKLAYMSLA